MEATAAGIAAEVSLSGCLLMTGRLVWVATGWKVALFLTVVTVIYNYFAPDELEGWLSTCPFGTTPDGGRTVEKRQAAFQAALAATGYEDAR